MRLLSATIIVLFVLSVALTAMADDDDERRFNYKKLENNIYLVYKKTVPPEVVAKYGLIEPVSECPEECQQCVDDIEFVYTLEDVEGADLSTFTAYSFDGKLLLVPTWVQGAPEPEPEPEPDPGPITYKPSRFNDFDSCISCHKKDESKFKHENWTPKLHDKHKEDTTCTDCHDTSKP